MATQEQNAASELTERQADICLRVTFGLLVAQGIGWAVAVTVHPGCWAMKSPLFTALGSAACFIFISICFAIGGGGFWLFTGSTAVFRWAFELLPAGVEPYRTAAGVAVPFMIGALVLAACRNARSLRDDAFCTMTVTGAVMFTVFAWVVVVLGWLGI